MKAAQITKPGLIEEVPLTEAKILNPPEGWLSVEVSASGICGTDLHIFEGEYLGDYPIIPGHEFSGSVIAVGENVIAFKPGNRVAVEPNLSCGFCDECRENRQHLCKLRRSVDVGVYGIGPIPNRSQRSVRLLGNCRFRQGQR